MTNFTYDVPTKVYFGENQIEGNLCSELKNYGKKVLLTYGGGSIKKSGLYSRVIKEIEDAGMELYELSGIDPNPRVTSVREGAKICKENDIDVLLAVGGGSVIDCTKYIGAATYYDGDAWDISLGKVDVQKCLPIITVLTLSATGSEMNSAGVISNLETQDKFGLIFRPMLPRVSFLDPTNTYTVSKYQTACGSADILSHIFEIYFAPQKDMFMLDGMMEAMIKTVIKYAPIAMQEPDNYEARANLMWASTWAINTFAKAGKNHAWTCHPIEHELSAIYDITHGLGLAILTPRWMDYCLDESTVDKFYDYGVNVFDIDKSMDKMQVAELSIKMTADFLYGTLGLDSTLGAIGIDGENFAHMASKSVGGDKIYGFKTLEANDVVEILKMCQ